jgi:hypothetical protein
MRKMSVFTVPVVIDPADSSWIHPILPWAFTARQIIAIVIITIRVGMGLVITIEALKG